MPKKVALITGVNGQDGYYLSELLFSKNYHVVGLTRNDSTLSDKIEYVQGDITNSTSLYKIIERIKPDEIYNLASQSHIHKSWDNSTATAEVNAIGAQRLFDIALTIKPDTRIFQASSSQIFENTHDTYQTEESYFNPTSPYAVAKLYAHYIANIYREKFNHFISCGILYNHESPKRGMHFITQKITYAAACLKHGITHSNLLNELGEPIVKHGKLFIGNLDATRDWGHAADYVKAMWLILQHNQPDNFIIATGKNFSIRDLCEKAFSYVGLSWEKYIETDQRLIRTHEPIGKANITKIKNILSWEPKVNFDQMVFSMVDSHLHNITLELSL